MYVDHHKHFPPQGLVNSLQFTFHWERIIVGIEDEEMPGGFALEPAYPNPFNPATKIEYTLSTAGPLAIHAYDALGRRVATLFDDNQVPGTHEVTFDATGLSRGVYMIRLEAPGVPRTRLATLLK